MTQDVCIPLQKARHMLMFCQMYLDIRPLWLCPILNTRRGPKIFSLGGLLGDAWWLFNAD